MLIVSIITVTLAIQNIRNAEEKERAAVRAKNEQLRADLLRTISRPAYPADIYFRQCLQPHQQL